MDYMDEARYNYLLPIGSIVKVNKVNTRLMIFGVLQKVGSSTMYDYIAVPYPEGAHNVKSSLAFNHCDVEEVIFRGFEDDSRKAFLLVLEALARKSDKE